MLSPPENKVDHRWRLLATVPQRCCSDGGASTLSAYRLRMFDSGESRLSPRLQYMRETFKFSCWLEACKQSMTEQPRRCSLNAMFAAKHLGFRYAIFSASVREGRMQCCEVNTRLACMLVYDREILKVLTFYKVRFKEPLV